MTANVDAFRLDGRVALVTGGSSGIGRQQGAALAEAGAGVVLVGRRAEALADAIAEIETAGGRAAALVVDLETPGAVEKISERASAPFGPPDILVNAAGINLREPIETITPDSWDRTLDLNLSVPFFLAQALVGPMQDRGWGRIINIASLQSSRAFPDSAAYGASKGGIAQLTRAMAEAWSSAGITCNAIAPGFFPTALTGPVFQDEALAAQRAAQTMIGRNGRLEDLDGLTVFLAAPASDYITGQIIHLDGGFTAK